MELTECFDRIRARPDLHRLAPPGTTAAIAEAEQRLGLRLADDLRAFYRFSDGAWLLRGQRESPYRIMPLARLAPARQELVDMGDEWYQMHTEHRRLPSDWLAWMDTGDGDWVVWEPTAGSSGGRYIDCFHETCDLPGYCRVVACGLAELLSQALTSDGHSFWLQDGFRGHGWV